MSYTRPLSETERIEAQIDVAVGTLHRRVAALAEGLKFSQPAATLWRDVVSYAVDRCTAGQVADRQGHGGRRVERELRALKLPSLKTLLMGARTSYMIHCVRAGHSVWPVCKALGASDVSTYTRGVTRRYGLSPKSLAMRYGGTSWNDWYLGQYARDLAPLWQVFLLPVEVAAHDDRP